MHGKLNIRFTDNVPKLTFTGITVIRNGDVRLLVLVVTSESAGALDAAARNSNVLLQQRALQLDLTNVLTDAYLRYPQYPVITQYTRFEALTLA